MNLQYQSKKAVSGLKMKDDLCDSKQDSKRERKRGENSEKRRIKKHEEVVSGVLT